MNTVNPDTTDVRDPPSDWMDQLLAAEAAGDASDYIVDQGFTARVMQALPLAGALPAWRRPAVVALWAVAGLLLAWQGHHWGEGWFHAKLALLLVMQLVHAAYARWRRQFATDANRHGDRFYRVSNELPTLLMVLIVLLAVVKPF